MRVAIYPSVLYGADFVVESIRSILPHVDYVCVVMMQRPWGQTEGVSYKGRWIPWPARFDDTRTLVRSIRDDRVSLFESQKDTPWNRWGHGYDVVRGAFSKKIDEVILIDPDCVFHADEAKRAFADWEAHPEYVWASVGQVELWRTPAWQVHRPRSMVSFHRGDLTLLSHSTEQNRPVSHALAGKVHNLGFCVSEAAMRWKHLTALAFSPVVGESMPNVDWFEEKWLHWMPGVINLDVSVGTESSIPCAKPYDAAGLPESIKKRFDAGEWDR